MEKVNLKDWSKTPNLISLFRIVFIPIVIILFKDVDNNRWFLILSLIVFSILDNLDGFVARKLNQITELGKVIDPVVDKLFVIIVAFEMYLYKLIPDWFFFLVLARDLLIIFAGLIFLKNVNRVPPSDIIGKLTVGAIGFVFLISLLNFQIVGRLYHSIVIITAFLIILSLINYGYKQIKKLR
jgi:cardiolipin synthase